MAEVRSREKVHGDSSAGFSLIEMLTSVALIVLLMSLIFGFMGVAQKRFQGVAIVSEANQGARAALEVFTQEVGQAGYNPNFKSYRTFQQLPVYGMTDSQCVPVFRANGTTADVSKIDPGDWLSVDTGGSNELVQVLATSATPDPAGTCTATYTKPCPCPLPSSTPCLTYAQPCSNCTAGQPCIKAVFQADHVSVAASPPGKTTAPWPVESYKFSYPTGILTGSVNGFSTSDDKSLEIYGDINQDGVIRDVIYSLNPTTSPATTVNITNAACTGTFTLYNLYRSVTPVQFPASISQTTSNNASPLAQNVLYNIPSSGPGFGPTCQPIFGYPNQFLVGITPNQISVIGTIVFTLSVAVNPQPLETKAITWYTMATEIRPLNLAAAVSVNQIGGYKFLPRAPLDLPMIRPSGYYGQ